MTKADLRRIAKQLRDDSVAAMSTAERCAAAIILAEKITEQLRAAKTVAVYLPIGSEMDTLPLIDRLVACDVQIALPQVRGRRDTMRFLAWAPGDALPEGPMGLRQPGEEAPEVVPDVILTPLLAFDSALNRLGYGAGHYDRAFAANMAARRIGISWGLQCVDDVPIESWDVPLHAVATETDWITT
ncbi:MAG: 5-formyltetrahydrofolate cyclo-ligase [Sphingomonadales bacterium]